MASKIKKIMHLITTSEIGGAEIQLDQLLAHMDHPSLRHCVVSMARAGVIAEKIRSRGIEVYSLNMKRGALSVSSVAGLLKLFGLVRSERPAIIQSWMYHASLLGVLVGKLMGIRSVFWNIRCAEMDMAHYPKLTRLVIQMLRHMSRVPQLVIVNSEAGRMAHIRKGFCPETFQVIPNGFELDRFRPDDSAREWFLQEFDVAGDPVIVGLVARYDPMKDHKMFLAAISQVHSEHPMSVFVLCGKNVDESNSGLMHLIEYYGLNSSVRLLGLRQDISRITAAFDIACSSSSFGEGFSNAIGEAMASEVPCVVTDVGDSGWIVGSTGRVVPAGDADAFAQALSELIACGCTVRKLLGAQARTRIADLFDIHRVADRYREMYLACH